jgi:hypothetical protein
MATPPAGEPFCSWDCLQKELDKRNPPPDGEVDPNVETTEDKIRMDIRLEQEQAEIDRLDGEFFKSEAEGL